MHQAIEHATANTRHRLPARPTRPAGGSTPTLFSTNRGYPFPRRRAQERGIVFTTLEALSPSPPTLLSFLATHRAVDSATNARKRGGTTLSRPNLAALRPSGTQHPAHAKQAHTGA